LLELKLEKDSCFLNLASGRTIDKREDANAIKAVVHRKEDDDDVEGNGFCDIDRFLVQWQTIMSCICSRQSNPGFYNIIIIFL